MTRMTTTRRLKLERMMGCRMALLRRCHPEPDFANTTWLAFSRENRSKITRLLLCRLMPYMMPELVFKDEEVKGKVVASDVVSMFLVINK